MDSELNDLLLTKYFVVKSQIDSVSSRTIFLKKTLENTVATIKNGQSRENWQHRVHKTRTNKTETQQHMGWTPLCTSKHK
jgi:hypothetical protein